jgi:hypothetical protein
MSMPTPLQLKRKKIRLNSYLKVDRATGAGCGRTAERSFQAWVCRWLADMIDGGMEDRAHSTTATRAVGALARNGEVATTAGGGNIRKEWLSMAYSGQPESVARGQHEPMGTSDDNSEWKRRRRHCLGVVAEMKVKRLRKTSCFCLSYVPLAPSVGVLGRPTVLTIFSFSFHISAFSVFLSMFL